MFSVLKLLISFNLHGFYEGKNFYFFFLFLNNSFAIIF